MPDPTTADDTTTPDLVPRGAAPPRPVRPVRRPLRARGADPGPRAARRGPPEGGRRPRVRRRAGPAAPHLHRPAEHHHRGAAVRRALRRGARHPQARGPQPHRLAQDQQRARPGAAHQADGQDPGHRRDRRRPARRRHRHRRRPDRARLHRLHGRGRHRAPGAQRRPDEDPRRRGRAGRPRQRAPSRTPSTRRCATGSPTSTTTHYLIGTVTGPHPFPEMVRDFHKIIGEEAREQVLELTGRLPDAVIACVGGGSNAMGIFHRVHRRMPGVRLVGVEAGGDGHRVGPARGALRLDGHPGRAARRDELPPAGRRRPDRRVALDLGRPRLPGRRARARLAARQRPRRVPRTPPTTRSMEAFRLLSRTEGIIPAIESAHALVGAMEVGQELGPDALLLVNLSGRGDKDMETAARYFGLLEGVVVTTTVRRRRGGAAPLPRRGPRRAHRLPAGRLPDRRGLDRGDARARRRRRATSSRSGCPTATR